MYKGIKYLFVVIGIAVIVSCSSGKSQQTIEAEDLVEQARTAIDDGDYETAMQVLDSLDTNYKSQVDAIRESLVLRPRAVVLEGRVALEALNDEFMADSIRLDSLAMLMRHVNIPGTEGYLIAKSAGNGDFMSTTGISGRVDELGRFYLVSSVAGAGSLKHTSVTMSDGGRSVTTPTVDYDGEINYRSEGGEIITFAPEKCDSIVSFLLTVPVTSKIDVIYNGASNRTVKSKVNAAPLVTGADYSATVSRQRTRAIEREHIASRIKLAEKQIEKYNSQSSTVTDK